MCDDYDSVYEEDQDADTNDQQQLIMQDSLLCDGKMRLDKKSPGVCVWAVIGVEIQGPGRE